MSVDVLCASRRTVSIKTEFYPFFGPNEGGIRTPCAGICGSDYRIIKGTMDKRVNPPTLIGHSGRCHCDGPSATDTQGSRGFICVQQSDD